MKVPLVFVSPQGVLVAGVSGVTVDFDINVKVKSSADEEERVMKIGEAARKVGAPARMLRYYEQQGLIESSRSANGYRDYSEGQVEQARHVRALVEAGLSTRMIKIVLDNLEFLERRQDGAPAGGGMPSRRQDMPPSDYDAGPEPPMDAPPPQDKDIPF